MMVIPYRTIENTVSSVGLRVLHDASLRLRAEDSRSGVGFKVQVGTRGNIGIA